MVANHRPLIIKTIQELQAGVQHLEYSYRKVQKIPLHKDQMDEEQLESCEGFVSRFAWVSDLYLSKYLRTKVLIADPAFRGEILDLLNKAEKMGLIQKADDWTARFDRCFSRNFS